MHGAHWVEEREREREIFKDRLIKNVENGKTSRKVIGNGREMVTASRRLIFTVMCARKHECSIDFSLRRINSRRSGLVASWTQTFCSFIVCLYPVRLEINGRNNLRRRWFSCSRENLNYNFVSFFIAINLGRKPGCMLETQRARMHATTTLAALIIAGQLEVR